MKTQARKVIEKAGTGYDPLKKDDYELVTFRDCDFSGNDLSSLRFIECVFERCNLSMAKLANTAIQDCEFRNCKMMGMRFDLCNKFSLAMSFEGCILDHSSFFKARMSKTRFNSTRLLDCDFSGADLSACIFHDCDLANSTFENTVLFKADLHTSQNFTIDPAINDVRKAKFSLSTLPGLLRNFDIEIIHDV